MTRFILAGAYGTTTVCDFVGSMVLALSNALTIDIGLIGVFMGLFPALAQGLIAFAAAAAYGEKQENDEYRRTHRIPGSEI